jgi:hypothetical protein
MITDEVRETPRFQCNIDFDVATFAFQGTATFTARSDFLSAFLAAVVELGGAPLEIEISDHLLPEVPRYVGRAMIENLRYNGLLEREDDFVILTEAGLVALKRNLVPQPTNNLWRVRYLAARSGLNVVLSCTPSTATTWDLRQSSRAESSQPWESESRLPTSSELLGRELPLCSGASHVVLDPHGAYSGSRIECVARAVVTSSDGETTIVKVTIVGGDESESVAQVPPQMAEYVNSVVDEVFKQFQDAADVGVDDLTDKEVLAKERSQEIADFTVEPHVTVRDCIFSAIRVTRRVSEREKWFLRLLALSLTENMSVQEWISCAHAVAHELKFVKSLSIPELRDKVVSDIERRSAKHSEAWWAAHSSFDWDLA